MPIVKMELGELDAMRDTEKKLRKDICEQKLDYEKRIQEKEVRLKKLQKDVEELSSDVPVIAIHDVNENISIKGNMENFHKLVYDHMSRLRSRIDPYEIDVRAVAVSQADVLVERLEPIISANYKAFLDSEYISVERNSAIERKKIVQLDKIKNMVIEDVNQAIELENKNLKKDNRKLIDDIIATKGSVEEQVNNRTEDNRKHDKAELAYRDLRIEKLSQIIDDSSDKHKEAMDRLEFDNNVKIKKLEEKLTDTSKYYEDKLIDTSKDYEDKIKDIRREYESNAQAKIDLKKDELVKKLQNRIKNLESGRGFFARLFWSKKQD